MDRRDRVQLVEEGDCCLASRILRSRQTAGKDVPAGTMAMVSSSDFLRASERPTAISTLNRQRHLTRSCGGSTPTTERTVGPARISLESLTPRPGESHAGRKRAEASASPRHAAPTLSAQGMTGLRGSRTCGSSPPWPLPRRLSVRRYGGRVCGGPAAGVGPVNRGKSAISFARTGTFRFP